MTYRRISKPTEKNYHWGLIQLMVFSYYYTHGSQAWYLLLKSIKLMQFHWTFCDHFSQQADLQIPWWPGEAGPTSLNFCDPWIPCRVYDALCKAKTFGIIMFNHVQSCSNNFPWNFLNFANDVINWWNCYVQLANPFFVSRSSETDWQHDLRQVKNNGHFMDVFGTYYGLYQII